jgi:L-malate glycosyltransferase
VAAPLKVMQLVLSLVIGGTEKLVYDLVCTVDRQRVMPVVCCLDEVGELGEDLRQRGYPVYVLHRHPGIDWSLIPRLQAILRKEQVEIIHAQQYTPYFYGLLAAMYGKLTAGTRLPKIVFTEHGIPYPYQKKVKRLLLNPLLLLFADDIITIAEYTKSLLIEFENFPAQRTRVLYNGINLNQFSRKFDPAPLKQSLGIPREAEVIGIVARLDPVKNHAMLFRAFQRVLRHCPDTYLLIVGHGPEESGLKSLSESLGIRKNTLFLGARRDVADLLHVFDIFVLPSLSEGMSVTLIEAMGAGLPIVATRVGGNPEVVKDQETGYLVESDNDKELADRLISLLEHDEKRLKLGAAGQKRAYERFSLENMVNAYTRVYFNASGLNPPAPLS